MLRTTLEQEVARLRSEAVGRRLVFVSGNFNIIHPGHLRLLNFARSCGDLLVVGVFEDGEPGVALPLEVRREGLESLEAVGEVVPLCVHELTPLVAALQPYAVVKGREHEGSSNAERDVLRAYGGRLIFSADEARFSTADLLRRELEQPAEVHVHHVPEFLDAHGTSLRHLADVVRGFDRLKVAVLGDLVIDEYITCDPLGMSQEDPTIVVTPVGSRVFTGGAGIVAGHVARLGGQASFLSITGNDEIATRSEKSLADYGVRTHLIRDQSRPTILKQRYRASNKTLLRVSHLRTHDAGEDFINEALGRLEKLLPDLDLLIFSDFNYGCLPAVLVSEVCRRCNVAGVPYIADSQASSQVGDVSRFIGATMISATEREVRLSINDFKSGLQNVADRLLQKTQAKMLFVKLGAEGLLVLTKSSGFATYSLPAMNRNPVDVAGAGDAFLASAGLGLAAGCSAWECAYLGSVAAAIQVSRVGNVPITLEALSAALRNVHW
jgi:rfaE bifunctional protein kinase chain/domain